MKSSTNDEGTPALSLEVQDSGQVLPPSSTTGVTPTLCAASISTQPSPWTLTPLAPTPNQDKKTPPSNPMKPSPKYPKFTAGGDVGASRTASNDCDEDGAGCGRALANSSSLLSGTIAARGERSEMGERAIQKDGEQDDEDGDEDEDSDDSEEDDMLARMAVAARQRTTSRAGSSSNPTTPQGARRGTPSSVQSAPAGRPVPRTADSAPIASSPCEDGWDSFRPRRVRNRASELSRGESGEPGSSSTIAPDLASKGASACTAATHSVQDEDDFGGIYDAYYAAKDGARRVAGKHSRSVRQTAQREQAMAVREVQRSGGRR